MSDTRDKLDEARYFLDRVKEYQEERTPFRFNLNAFLSAARSITLFMQGEYDDAPGFKEWYQEQQVAMHGDKMMRLMNEKRRITIHTGALRPRARISIALSAQAVAHVEMSLRVIRADGTEEIVGPEAPADPFKSKEPGSPGVRAKWTWFFDDMEDAALTWDGERDVVTLCQEYIDRLSNLVAECEERFRRK